MKKHLSALVFFILVLSPFLLSQESKCKLFIKGGISDYGGTSLFMISGGAGEWKIGPILGLGIEYDLNKNWFLQGTIEYSYSTFGENVYYTESLESGNNSVTDIMGNLKKRWNWFYLIAGVGYSFQNSTDSYVLGNYNGEKYRRIKSFGTSTNILTGIIGIGFEFCILQNTDIFLEGSWRIRKYVTPVVQLGINYNL